MKLKQEIQYVTRAFNNNVEKIKEYVPVLKASGKYNNFNTRLAWDCLKAFCGNNYICYLYDHYNCNDKHITTLAVHVLKNIGVINNE